MNSDARLDFDEPARDAVPFRSALSVRVEAAGRTIGVLSVYACREDAFDESHQRLVRAAADAIGLARLETSPAQIAEIRKRRVS